MATHTVEQGETMISIALAHGFSDWRKVWDDDANAELRKLREDPQVLMAGDEVAIPEVEVKTVELDTDTVHYFVRKAPTAPFSLTLLDEFGDPRAGCRYILEVEHLSFDEVVPDDGVIAHELPATAQIGVLTVFLDEHRDEEEENEEEEGEELFLEYPLQLGHLDPVSELSGIQARLILLGFDIAKADGSDNDETKLAIRTFQFGHMGRDDASGELDDETREAIEEAFSSR